MSSPENPEENASFREMGADWSAPDWGVGVSDPDLAAVVAQWPILPGAIKAGILAMVRAATRPGRPSEPDSREATAGQTPEGDPR